MKNTAMIIIENCEQNGITTCHNILKGKQLVVVSFSTSKKSIVLRIVIRSRCNTSLVEPKMIQRNHLSSFKKIENNYALKKIVATVQFIIDDNTQFVSFKTRVKFYLAIYN
jgi:hypothetical protein